MSYIHLRDYVKLLSHKIMLQFSSHPSLTIREADIDRINFNQCICAIHMSGQGLQIAYFVHFQYRKAAGLANNRFELKVDQLSNNQVADSMKEFCNLIGGHLCQIIGEAGVKVTYGLPFAIQGFNQLVLMDNEQENTQKTFWRLGTDDAWIDCSLRFSTDSDTAAAAIAKLNSESSAAESSIILMD